MASVSEMSGYVGRRGTWAAPASDGLEVQVPILVVDARERFAKIDLLVEPIGGSGQTWVSLSKITLEELMPQHG